MKNIYYLISLVITLFMVNCYIAYGADKEEKPLEINVMSFNIRNADADTGTPNSWDNRKALLYNVIRQCSPDVIGLQEALLYAIDEIQAALPEYGKIGEGRDGGTGGEYCAILYRHDRFDVDESGTFWLSDTPEKPSTSWSRLKRICTWARLVEKESGQSFYFYNTHLDHESLEAKEKGGRLIMTRIEKRKYQDPFVLTGDFNSGESDDIIKCLKGIGNITNHPLVDTFRVLYPEEKNVKTYNGFVGLTSGRKIDYVFVDSRFRTVTEAEIVRTHDGDRYPSDHYPVTAGLHFELKNKNDADVTKLGDKIAGLSFNYNGGEGPANAIDNNRATKYLNFDKENSGFIVKPSLGATIITGLVLTTANDCPERDPASITIRGSQDGINYVDIAKSLSTPLPDTRFAQVAFNIANNCSYNIYQVKFPALKNSAVANSMQIGEVALTGIIINKDVTEPGDMIKGTSANYYPVQSSDNAIDDDINTKYLNFDKENSGFTVAPSAGLTIITGIVFITANDKPERDPASVTICGSLDGVNFIDIAKNMFTPLPDERFARVMFNFTNELSFCSYQVVFPTLKDSAVATGMQISEISLLGKTVRTDVTTPEDRISGTSNNFPDEENPQNAIDNNNLTKYLNFDKENSGFIVELAGKPTIIDGITLTTANDHPERDPASVTIRGSFDGNNFVDIVTGFSTPLSDERFNKSYFNFQNSDYYNVYKVIFPTLKDSGSANSMQIAEVELMGEAVPEPLSSWFLLFVVFKVTAVLRKKF